MTRTTNALVFTLVMAAAASAVAQTTLVFRNGLNGYADAVDTRLVASAPDATAGVDTIIGWSANEPAGSGQDAFALVRFENLFGAGPNQIPPDAGIVDARLRYWLDAGTSVGEIREALVEWDETTTASTFGPVAGVQSSDFTARRYGTARGTSASQTINVWESLTTWQDDPSQNRGWIFRPANNTTFGDFYSSEYDIDPSKRITLTVIINDTEVPMLVRRPSVQNVSSAGFTVLWRTDQRTDSVVRYGAAPDMLDQVLTVAESVRDHEVRVTGFEPGQTVYYAVGTSDHVLAGADAGHVVTMAPARDYSFARRIWAFGDSGAANSSLLAMRDAMLAHLGGAPDAIITAGDMAYLFAADGEYSDAFFAPFAATLRATPVWPSVGNHDELNANSLAGTGAYYEAYALPQNGEAGGAPSGTEAFYSFDLGDVHFIAINSSGVSFSAAGPMRTWLEQDLQQTNANWLICYLHHAPYSNGTHDADTDARMTSIRELIVPTLEQYGLDLMVGGHSHGYERSFLLNGAYETPVLATGHIVDGGDGDPLGDGAYMKPAGLTPNAGAVYVVAGHAQASHGVSPHPVMAFGENEVGSVVITIQDDTMVVENVRADGVVSDRFAIVKGGGGPTADLNGDGVVNGADLATMLALWGACAGCAADLNLDGQVNGADLAQLLAQWSA